MDYRVNNGIYRRNQLQYFNNCKKHHKISKYMISSARKGIENYLFKPIR